MAKPALGRGLGALLGPAPAIPPPVPEAPTIADRDVAAPRHGVLRVALSSIQPCPFQPRKRFAEESLRELADSIRERGVVQPLLVRPREGIYELIAGERRWRAAQLLGLAEVPVILREADDPTALELALIENLQRENLNAIEEAQGFAQLIEQFRLTQEEAAARVGKSRAAVANALRLLKLDPEVQGCLRDERLSVGHAKVLLGLTRPGQQKLAADRVLRHALSVRQTEQLVTRLQEQSAVANPNPGSAPTADPHVARLRDRLQERLGTRVDVRYRKGKGAVQIHFFNDDDLERVLGILGVPPE